MHFLLSLTILMLAISSALGQSDNNSLRDFDTPPKRIADALALQRSSELSASPRIDPAARAIFSKRRWTPGSTLLVAFNGGNSGLHEKIARIANEWTRGANIKFDFIDRETGHFRQWSSTDTIRKAHIRVGFLKNEDGGFWSFIGTDSLSSIATLDLPTLNLGNYDDQWPLVDSRFRTIVLHEFGHAIGFFHEHQRSSCEEQYNWDTASQNNVYSVFYDLYGWDQNLVNLNLRGISQTRTGYASGLDRKSIMMYALPSQIFKERGLRNCLIGKEAKSLSPTDIKGVNSFYPANATQAVTLARSYAQALENLANQPRTDFTQEESKAINLRYATAREAQRPLLYLHILREADRPLAKRMQSEATVRLFLAPGIENVSRKGLKSGKRIEVRYFRPIDKVYATEAMEIARRVAGVDTVRVVRVARYANKVTRNLVEIWIP